VDHGKLVTGTNVVLQGVLQFVEVTALGGHMTGVRVAWVGWLKRQDTVVGKRRGVRQNERVCILFGPAT
jgi:hypothetical protein